MLNANIQTFQINRELLTNLTTLARVQTFHPRSMGDPNAPSMKRNPCSSSNSKKTTTMSRSTSTVRSRMATARSSTRRMENQVIIPRTKTMLTEKRKASTVKKKTNDTDK